MLEREAELRGLERLERLVAQAAGRDRRVGLIEGPPGIGKTSLVSAARRLAAEAVRRGPAGQPGEGHSRFA